jgi:hypothetical protein
MRESWSGMGRDSGLSREAFTEAVVGATVEVVEEK